MKIKSQKTPFQIGPPIQEPGKFIGRKKVLQQLLTAMRSLQHVSIRGERRTGKTSILRYLSHINSPFAREELRNHIPVYINFQDFITSDERTVWHAIAEGIEKQIKVRFPERQAEAKQFFQTIEKYLSSPIPSTAFGTAIEQLREYGLTIHLLLDEFDQTKKNSSLQKTGFYDILRGLPDKTNQNLTYVTATRAPLSDLQNTRENLTSPFFNIFSQFLLLPPFTEDEAFQLIFEYLERSNISLALVDKLWDDVDFLYSLTGYHPFFLQVYCSNLYTRLDMPDWPQGIAKKEALQEFEDVAREHFKFYWDQSSKSEQKLIVQLATNQTIDWENSETLNQRIRLKERCLVVKATNPELQWQLFSSSFQDWVKTYINLPKETEKSVQLKVSSFENGAKRSRSSCIRIRVYPSRIHIETDKKTSIPVPFQKNVPFLHKACMNLALDIAKIGRGYDTQNTNLQEVTQNLAEVGQEIGHALFKDKIVVLESTLHSSPEDIEIIDRKGIWIPWELIHFGKPNDSSLENFLGFQRNIYRTPPHQGRTLEIQANLLGFLGHDKVPHTWEEYYCLEKHEKAEKIRRMEWPRLTEGNISPGWFESLNIIHFAGLINPISCLDKSLILVNDNYWMSPELFTENRFKFSAAPLVVFNVRDNYARNPRHIFRYAKLFLEHGAAGVVASEFPIPPDMTLKFAEYFYDYLFSTQNPSLALKQTKNALIEDCPFVMFYVPYFGPSDEEMDITEANIPSNNDNSVQMRSDSKNVQK